MGGGGPCHFSSLFSAPAARSYSHSVCLFSARCYYYPFAFCLTSTCYLLLSPKPCRKAVEWNSFYFYICRLPTIVFFNLLLKTHIVSWALLLDTVCFQIFSLSLPQLLYISWLILCWFLCLLFFCCYSHLCVFIVFFFLPPHHFPSFCSAICYILHYTWPSAFLGYICWLV